MTQVSYSAWLRDVGIFATSDLPHFAYIDHSQATLYIQSSRLRDHQTIMQRVFLQADTQMSLCCIGKCPMLGFRWLDADQVDKFQIKFASAEAYDAFVQSLSRYLTVQAPAAVPPRVTPQQGHFVQRGNGTLALQDAFRRTPLPTARESTLMHDRTSHIPSQSSTQTLPGSQTSTSGAMETVLSSQVSQAVSPAIPRAIQATVTEASQLSGEELDTRLAAFLKDERCLALLQAVDARFTAAGLHQTL